MNEKATTSRVGRQSEREFILLLATLSGTTALGIDMILPAFSLIRSDLGLPADSSRVALTVTAYFLGLAFTQLIYGPLSDRFGRRVIIWVGLGLYAVGGISAALSPNFAWLVASRLLWGIGAAAPRVAILAIARDVYDGDRLARVLTMVAAVFMVIPTIGPLLGEAVLLTGSWRLVVVTPAILGLVLAVWVTRLDESLAPERRQPLNLARTGQALKTVVSTRITLAAALALVADFGAFSAFLGSSALLFDDVFDRKSWFAVSFGVMSIFMGVSTWASSRLVTRFGSRRLINVLNLSSVCLAAALTIVSVRADGSPNFWVWFLLIVGVNSIRTPLSSLTQSEAMQPMGDLAGTASSVIGSMSMGLGAIIGSSIDQLTNASVTPLAVGYLVASVTFMALLRWGRAGAG